MARELARTKPYSYSIFAFEVLCAIAQILSTPEENLWMYEDSTGSSLKKGMDFIFPYMEEKSLWPYAQDILHWEDLPVKNTFLVFAAQVFNQPILQRLYDQLPTSNNPEVQRNLPLLHPELWTNG